MQRFENLGIIKNNADFDKQKLTDFQDRIDAMKLDQSWTKQNLVDLFHHMIPDFGHKETGKYLDSKM